MSKFGTSNKEYSDLYLRSLIKSAKTPQELQTAKAYLLTYFARADVGVYRWIPKTQTVKHYKKLGTDETIVPNNVKKFYNEEGEEIDRFYLISWFMKNTP